MTDSFNLKKKKSFRDGKCTVNRTTANVTNECMSCPFVVVVDGDVFLFEICVTLYFDVVIFFT